MCMGGSATTSTAVGLAALGPVGLGIAPFILPMTMQYDNARMEGEYQQDLAKYNATMAGYQADAAGRRGEMEIDAIRREVAQVTGAGRAAYGAGNIILGSGSPLSWEQGVAASGARDIETSRYNTAMEQWGYRNQASGYLAEGSNAMASARRRGYASLLAGTSSLIGQGVTAFGRTGGA